MKTQKSYIIKEVSSGVFSVLRLSYTDEGITDEETYRVSLDSCTCKAFDIHGKCKHQDMVFSKGDYIFDTEPMEIRQAQSYMRDWIKDLQEVFERVWLPTDPYKRDEHDKVVEITVCASKPKNPTVLMPGVWKGKLRGLGIMGVLRIL